MCVCVCVCACVSMCACVHMNESGEVGLIEKYTFFLYFPETVKMRSIGKSDATPPPVSTQAVSFGDHSLHPPLPSPPLHTLYLV